MGFRDQFNFKEAWQNREENKQRLLEARENARAKRAARDPRYAAKLAGMDPGTVMCGTCRENVVPVQPWTTMRVLTLGVWRVKPRCPKCNGSAFFTPQVPRTPESGVER